MQLVKKTMRFLIITLCFCVLCACNNKKDIQTIDTTPYFTDESYIYILSGVDFIKKIQAKHMRIYKAVISKPLPKFLGKS